MRFNVALMDGWRFIDPLNNDIGFLESCLHVPFFQFHTRRNIRSFRGWLIEALSQHVLV